MPGTIILDAGSTTTKAAFLVGDTVEESVFPPININYHSELHIHNALRKLKSFSLATECDKIIHYGTGCGTVTGRTLLRKIYMDRIPEYELEIYPDTLGSARALFSNQSGISCILGTGSNACYFDGSEIVETSPSLGYVLGDEGSAMDIGRRLIRAYFYRRLSPDLMEQWSSIMPNRESLVESLYRKEFPNRFVADFAKEARRFVDNVEVRDHIESAFREFLECHVVHLTTRFGAQPGFTGSVAWSYQDILRVVCTSYGYDSIIVHKDPLNGLVNFHKQHGYV